MENLLYSKDHEWIKREGDTVLIGITDYAQKSLGEIVYVELPEVGDVLEAEGAFGVIESVKAASDSYMPVSGRIVEVNDELEENPVLLNEDAFGTWIIRVEMSRSEELGELMDAQAYSAMCEEE